MRRLLFGLVVVAGCTKADPTPAAKPAPAPAPGVAFAQPPPATPTPTVMPPPAAVDVKVELTAVTLADECGGQPPMSRPSRGAARRSERLDSRQRADMSARACEQTSMQLSLSSSAAAKITIKSVELLDEKGASLGMLTPSKPTRWVDATSRYDAWDESLEANTNVNVSYVLQQPNWSKIGNRWNRMFVLKTVVSIGGVDRAVTKNVTTQAQVTLPPNVRT